MCRRLVTVLGLVAVAAVATATVMVASAARHTRVATAQSQAGAPSMAASETDALRELAVRLMAFGRGGTITFVSTSESSSPPSPAPRARVLARELPDDLPFDIPLPPGARLLGSVFADFSDRFRGVPAPPELLRSFSLSVVVDVPDSLDVYGYYDAALAERGWSPPPPSLFGIDFGGFQDQRRAALLARASGATTPRGIYCLAPTRERPGDASFSVHVYQGEVGLYDVRLDIDGGWSTSLCGLPVPTDGLRLPTLTLPAEVSLVQTNTLPTRPDSALGSDATIATAAPIAELEAHFAEQLAAAGWTRQDGAITDLLAWSVWSSPDGGRRGFLSVVAVPGDDVRQVSFLTRARRDSR